MLSHEFRLEFEERHYQERQKEHRYAVAHGYFWLPCSICGTAFGGHEKHGHWQTPCRGKLTCEHCAPEARRRSAEYWERYWGRYRGDRWVG